MEPLWLAVSGGVVAMLVGIAGLARQARGTIVSTAKSVALEAVREHQAACPVEKRVRDELMKVIDREAEERREGRHELREAIEESERRTTAAITLVRGDVAALSGRIDTLLRNGRPHA